MKSWDPGAQPEGEVVIGKQGNQWMVHLFINEAHAVSWAAENPRERRLWRARVSLAEELEYVPPGEARLQPKGTLR